MQLPTVQELCQRGQDELSRMEYLLAEMTLSRAEALARESSDWDSLARLYLPLQESRRQRRQRCGEGTIRLDFFALDSSDWPGGEAIVDKVRQGQVLIAGWGSIEPALAARKHQTNNQLYVDIFLGAVYPMGTGRIIAIMPDETVMLPPPAAMTPDDLIRRLPPHSLLMSEAELQSTKTYEATMAMWEKLHAPFLAAAGSVQEPIRRIDAYRRVIGIDYACELAHQNLSDTARKLAAGVIS